MCLFRVLLPDVVFSYAVLFNECISGLIRNINLIRVTSPLFINDHVSVGVLYGASEFITIDEVKI